MAKKKLDGIWNADRFLQELISLSEWNGSIRVDNVSDSPYGIQLQRLVAVMNAYGVGNCSDNSIKCIVSEACSDEKMKEFRQLVMQNLQEGFVSRLGDRFKLPVRTRDRQRLFDILFSYRKNLYEIEHPGLGMLECPLSFMPPLEALNNLYQEHIKSVADIVQRMLLLLMGDDYDKCFTEEELLQYGYPNVSDKELDDMIFDNM